MDWRRLAVGAALSAAPTGSCQLRLALRGDDVAEQPVGFVVGPGGEVEGVGGDVE
jgi:hypothetical protein